MKKKVCLTDIRLSSTSMGTRVDYCYEAPDELTDYIKGEPLFVEYPCDVRDVPKAVLAVPFVGIMATVTMLLNIEIDVPVLEKRFYNSIESISKVYNTLYPGSNLKLCVKSAETEECDHEAEGSALMFTGGVDATSALISVAEQKPVILNIWGGDLRLTDNASHEELEVYLQQLSEHMGLKYAFIKTNARETFKEDELGYLTTRHVGSKNEYGWWATIAHSLSMLSTVIPWAWKNKIENVYLGSTHAAKEASYDANHEDLLNAIVSGSCKMNIADGDLVRNEKVTKIVRWKEETKTPIRLKVCWRRTAGKNCSACEKCYRTILNIISNHGDPNEFGFEVDAQTLLAIKRYLQTHHVGEAFWVPIQQAFLAEKDYWATRPEIAWILTIKLNSFQTLFWRAKRRFFKSK